MHLGTDVIKLGEVDVSALAEMASTVTEEKWAENDARQKKFSVHTHTQTVQLIYDPDFRHRNPTRFQIMDEYEPLLARVFQLIEGHYAKALEEKIIPQERKPPYFVRIIMTRLSAGGEIEAHTDGGMSLKRCHRIHLPIITNEKCMFTSGETTLHMRAGELWEINNRQMHCVKNEGDESRVHIILDYVQPGEYIEDPKGPVVA